MLLLEVYDLIEAMFPNEIAKLKEKQELNESDCLDDSELEDLLYEHCDINLEQLELIIERLLPLCEHAKSPLTGTDYRGFAVRNIWIIRKKIN